METFSALLALCAGNSPVTAELWCFRWSAPWINGWVNNREAGDLRRHRAHYDVIVMMCQSLQYLLRMVCTGARLIIKCKWNFRFDKELFCIPGNEWLYHFLIHLFMKTYIISIDYRLFLTAIYYLIRHTRWYITSRNAILTSTMTMPLTSINKGDHMQKFSANSSVHGSPRIYRK